MSLNISTISLDYPFKVRTASVKEVNDYLQEIYSEMDPEILQRPLSINFANPLLQQCVLAIEWFIKNSGHSSIVFPDHPLTLGDLITLYGDGTTLAQDLVRLKSYTMCFLNNPLNQPAFKDKGCNDLLCPLIEKLHKLYMLEFLVGIYNDEVLKSKDGHSSPWSCLITGVPTFYDFGRTEWRINKSLEKTDVKVGSGATRNWVPLLGSLGSELQSLPALSSAFPISPLVLFLFQYLPYTTSIFGKMLVVYQSFSMGLIRKFVYSLVDHYVNELRSKSLNEKAEIIGKKNLADLLSTLFETVANYREEHPDEPLSLNLWFFSNSGNNPDADLISLPNEALNWITYEIIHGRSKEIKACLVAERKLLSSSNHLIPSITEQKDYPLFYNTKKNAPSLSLEFYFGYQQHILGWEPWQLYALYQFAEHVYKTKKKEDLKRILASGKSFDLIYLLLSSANEALLNNTRPLNSLLVFHLLLKNRYFMHASTPTRNSIDIIKFVLRHKLNNSSSTITLPSENKIAVENYSFDLFYNDETIPRPLKSWVATIFRLMEWYNASLNTNQSYDSLIQKHLRGSAFSQLRRIFLLTARKHPVIYKTYVSLLSIASNQAIVSLFLSYALRVGLYLATDASQDVGQIEKYTDTNLPLETTNLEILSDSFGLSTTTIEETNAYIRYLAERRGVQRSIKILLHDLTRISYDQLKLRFLEKDPLTFTEQKWMRDGVTETYEFSWSLLRFKLQLYLYYLLQLSTETIPTLLGITPEIASAEEADASDIGIATDLDIDDLEILEPRDVVEFEEL